MTTLIVSLCGLIFLMAGVIVFLCFMLSAQSKEIKNNYVPVKPPEVWEVRYDEWE